MNLTETQIIKDLKDHIDNNPSITKQDISTVLVYVLEENRKGATICLEGLDSYVNFEKETA